MARESKLFAALDAGQDHTLDVKKGQKLQNPAKKRLNIKGARRQTQDTQVKLDEGLGSENVTHSPRSISKSQNFHGGESSLERRSSTDGNYLSEEAHSVPLSDLASLLDGSSEDNDVVPYHRMTINNTAALTKAYRSILISPTLPFSAHQAVDSALQTEIQDVHDDLNRELAFYKQALDATIEARDALKDEGTPFSRPKDFFAEMVKNDEHMAKIQSKLVDEAANKMGKAEARKQRDLKKFGKQVQVAKLQERDRAKRITLEKINQLKKNRQDMESGNPGDDLFDVALASESKRQGDKQHGALKTSRVNRQRKDNKFGYGGKKRFSKSGDAMSSGDLSSFSVRKMKGVHKSTRRPGKSRRARLS